jgi:hypothetical protein
LQGGKKNDCGSQDFSFIASLLPRDGNSLRGSAVRGFGGAPRIEQPGDGDIAPSWHGCMVKNLEEGRAGE